MTRYELGFTLMHVVMLGFFLLLLLLLLLLGVIGYGDPCLEVVHFPLQLRQLLIEAGKTAAHRSVEGIQEIGNALQRS